MNNILQQDKNSMSYTFFYLQVEQLSRGDWASSCFKDLKELRITESLEEIRKMSKVRFNNILMERTKKMDILQKKEETSWG